MTEKTEETPQEARERRLKETKVFTVKLYGNPKDADKELFEYDKEYYYWNGQEVAVVKTKYHPNSLGEEHFKYGSAIFYHHYKTPNDKVFSVPVKLLYNTMERALVQGLQAVYKVVKNEVAETKQVVKSLKDRTNLLEETRKKLLQDLKDLRK